MKEFSIHHIQEALKCFSRGYDKGATSWWKKSLSTIIGFTSESLRYKELKHAIGQCLTSSSEFYIVPDTMRWLMKNWGVVGKHIHYNYTHHFLVDGQLELSRKELIDMVSLITNKDGTGGSYTSAVGMGGSPTPVLGSPTPEHLVLMMSLGEGSSSSLQHASQSRSQTKTALGNFDIKKRPLSYANFSFGHRFQNNKELENALKAGHLSGGGGSSMFSPH